MVPGVSLAPVVPQAYPAPVQFAAHNDDGFDDIEAGYGAFPMVKLDSGMFYIDNEKLGTEFTAHMFQSRKIFMYRAGTAGSKDAVVAYSYDHQYTCSGSALASILREWESEGLVPECEERREVAATITSGDHAGEIVLLSVPPTGATKLAGYRDRLKQSRGLRPSQVITRIKAGEPIKTKNNTFIPWTFEYVQPVTEAQAA